MNDRRALIALGAAGLGAWPLQSLAQPAVTLRRIAFLWSGSSSAPKFEQAFLGGLAELGWIEGRNLVIDRRLPGGTPSVAAAQTRELLALKPHVFVSSTDVFARTAVDAEPSVPVIFVLGFDPVGRGLVKSLAAPGGNATGFSILNYELNGKRLALLKEAMPRLATVGVLYREGDVSARAALHVTEEAGRELRITIVAAPVQGAPDLAGAFQRLASARAGAVINVPDPMFFEHRREIADLAKRHRIAASFGATEFAEAGMLMSYGTDFTAVFRRAAGLVDRVLKGASPASIPDEQINVYELVLNLGTARELGLRPPPSLMLQVTRSID